VVTAPAVVTSGQAISTPTTSVAAVPATSAPVPGPAPAAITAVVQAAPAPKVTPTVQPGAATTPAKVSKSSEEDEGKVKSEPASSEGGEEHTGLTDVEGGDDFEVTSSMEAEMRTGLTPQTSDDDSFGLTPSEKALPSGVTPPTSEEEDMEQDPPADVSQSKYSSASRITLDPDIFDKEVGFSSKVFITGGSCLISKLLFFSSLGC